MMFSAPQALAAIFLSLPPETCCGYSVFSDFLYVLLSLYVCDLHYVYHATCSSDSCYTISRGDGDVGGGAPTIARVSFVTTD